LFLNGISALAGVHATRSFGEKVLPESAGRAEVLAAGLTSGVSKSKSLILFYFIIWTLMCNTLIAGSCNC
jgi:hypothetical protein